MNWKRDLLAEPVANHAGGGAGLHQRLVLFILTAVQFTSIVDFMIVMPLGPQLMRTLNITPGQFGLIVSSYTFAAGLAGLVASVIVDRFDRRTAFMTLYAGFLIGTLSCAFAPNYLSLVLARVITGAFGGILGGMSMAIIGDVFPESHRGRATGSLMTGFALASVVGVPLGLVIGTEFGWHMTFIVLAIGGVPTLLLTPFAMPSLKSHVGQNTAHPLRSLRTVFLHSNHLKAFALIISLMVSGFTVFPYLSAYLVGNVGMTEAQLPIIYIAGGVLTLFAAPLVGRMSDRYGKLFMFRLIAPLSATLLLIITHLPTGMTMVAVVVFGALMVCNVGRMIPAMAMITSSVEPQYRGAFLSANSAVQHVAGGVAAYLAGTLITQTSDGGIGNFGTVGWIASISGFASLWLAGRLRPAASEMLVGPQVQLASAPAAEVAVDTATTSRPPRVATRSTA